MKKLDVKVGIKAMYMYRLRHLYVVFLVEHHKNIYAISRQYPNVGRFLNQNYFGINIKKQINHLKMSL